MVALFQQVEVEVYLHNLQADVRRQSCVTMCGVTLCSSWT